MASTTIKRTKNAGANRPTRRRARKVEPPHLQSATTDTAAPVPMTDEPLIGPTDVGLILGVPTSWVYMKSEAGVLPSYKLGHYRRFKRSEIEEYLHKCRSASRP